MKARISQLISAVVLLISIVNLVICQETTEKDASPASNLFMQTLIPFYFQQVFSHFRSLNPDNPASLLPALFTGVSPACSTHSTQWLQQIFNMSHLSAAESWALHMTDAWAKPPEGILSGHTNALGDYDECVGVHVEDGGSASFQGKYCASFVYPKNYPGFELDSPRILDTLMNLEKISSNTGVKKAVPVQELMELMFDLNGPWLLPSFGSCFPSSCSIQDTRSFIGNVLKELKLENELDFLTFDCFVQEKPKLGSGDIAMLVILGVLVVLCILAALVEFLEVEKLNVKKSKLKTAFFSFSIRKSMQQWLSTEKTGHDTAYGTEAIHGLSFLTAAWIVLANTWEIPLFGYHPVWNNVDMKTMYKNWTTLVITNGNVAIDTFFTLSGILVALKLLQLLDKRRGRINVFVFYARTLIRFTPTYAVVIGFVATLYPYLGSGPYSGYLHHAQQNCQGNWWTNLLYVNNFVNATFENICVTGSWYFANEMQFILLTPFILYPIWKWTKFGFVVAIFIMAGSIITPGLLTFDGEYLPAGIPTKEFHLYFQEIYIKPWIRSSPFLVGVICAYLIHTSKKSSRIPSGIVLGGWLLCTAAALSIIFSLFPYFDPNVNIPIEEASIYAALHRLGWGIVISWIVFVCSKGYGGFVNRFLSWAVFKPLARLTMATYLVALPVQMILHLRFRQAITHDSYSMVNFYLADLVMSLAVAFVLTILIKLPCHALAKELFHHEKPVEVIRQRQRFGIYYNNEISVSVDASALKGKDNPFEVSLEMRPRKRRYGIYYDDTISDNCTGRSH